MENTIIELYTNQVEDFDSIEDELYQPGVDEKCEILEVYPNGVKFTTDATLDTILTKLHIDYEHPWLLINNSTEGFVIVLDFKLDVRKSLPKNILD